jgi:hypothetical protein
MCIYIGIYVGIHYCIASEHMQTASYLEIFDKSNRIIIDTLRIGIAMGLQGARGTGRCLELYIYMYHVKR